jgi:hypothetical protein
MALNELPMRRGPKPRTHWGLPHQQLEQQPQDPSLRRRLAERLFSLDGVVEQPSGISVPGARAVVVIEERGPLGPSAAFFVGREFAHLHPAPDFSLHLHLPEVAAEHAIAAGWAELHPLVEKGAIPPTRVMIFAPRDGEELEIVWQMVQASYAFALPGSVPQDS